MTDAAQDTAVPPLSGKTAFRDRLGAIGAPRASAIPEARRHTARVAKMRRWIVWGVGAIVALVLVGGAARALRYLPMDLNFAHVALKGTRITIETPRLVGYRKDGRPYEIKARLGVQDIAKPDRFELEGLAVRIENSDDNSVRMTAEKGFYDAKNDHAELGGGVQIRDDRNFDMRLDSAAMDFKVSRMTSDKPVTLKFAGGEVNAQGVEFAHKERRATFAGGVRTVIYGETDEAPEKSAQTEK
jgi:lipopolysaccharide export system protein LptC